MKIYKQYTRFTDSLQYFLTMKSIREINTMIWIDTEMSGSEASKISYFCLFFFETGSHYIIQAGLKFKILSLTSGMADHHVQLQWFLDTRILSMQHRPASILRSFRLCPASVGTTCIYHHTKVKFLLFMLVTFQ
jgi:hypothetical protein